MEGWGVDVEERGNLGNILDTVREPFGKFKARSV